MGTTSPHHSPLPPAPTRATATAAPPACNSGASCRSSNSRAQQHATCATRTTQQPQQPRQHHLLRRHALVAAAIVAVAALGLLPAGAQANPVFVDNPSLAQFQSGRNIRHLPCIVRKSGRSGVCMFAIDCIKQNGTHLGTCIDRFYFGSCCQMPEETPFFAQEISDNSIDQNTISHFAHESTTLPTSALFKLTTEAQTHEHEHEHAHGEANATVTAPAAATTDREAETALTTTTARSPPAARPTLGSLPSRRPVATNGTHHKPSQFVVRTTARPTTKPPRRKTTTTAPLLTTFTQLEQRVETTTMPQKFFTFQIVETTTPPPTEPTRDDGVPTTTHRPRPSVLFTRTTSPPTTTAPPTRRTSTTSPTTTTTTTTSRPRPPSRPRPATTKKPTQTKRPSKPTRRPVGGTTTSTVAPPSRRPPPPAHGPETEGETQRPASQTTRAPRPKPKPTAEIVKVPKPAVGPEATTSRPAPTTTAAATRRPTTQAPPRTTRRPPTTTTSTTPPTTTSTSTTTTTTTTTERPTTTRRPPPPATSSTTRAPPTLTTEAPTTTTPAPTSTLKPGLVTWTNVDGEPEGNGTVDEWQPRPPPPDWVPVPTIAPEANKGTPSTTTTTTTTTTTPKPAEVTGFTTEGPAASSTEKIVVSVSSSVSETMQKPERPTPSVAATTTSTTSTTTTTTTTTTARPTTAAPTAAAATTSSPGDSESSTSGEMSTEEISGTATGAAAGAGAGTGTGTGSSTPVDYSTEDFNGTLSSTTATPMGSMEGLDYKQICGRRMFPEPRVVGGSNSAFGRWPWQISLRQWRTSTYLHKCGAALLNENWAITAAHCVDNVPPSDLLLRLGEYDLAEEEEPYGYQERRVQIVASHPQFDPRTFEYDLALLRFYEPVTFQPNIIPVCVPASDQDFIGQTAFVTGWGRLYEDGPLPSVLQEVAVPVINNTICETMYRAAGYIEHIPHIFICAGWKKGGYDSCEGDSGGPMVVQREDDKRFELGGVISWGIGCAEPNQPGVYTRISEFRDWINQILQF